MAKGALLAVIVGLALIGCATPQEPRTPPPPAAKANYFDCTGGAVVVCRVAVKVQCSSGACKPVPYQVDGVTPADFVIISARTGKDSVHFELDNFPSYQFGTNAIVFDTPGVWTCPVSGSGKIVICTTNSRTTAVYKYAITVTGPAAVPNDPWVVNN
jgi:hypothetical protein